MNWVKATSFTVHDAIHFENDLSAMVVAIGKRSSLRHGAEETLQLCQKTAQNRARHSATLSLLAIRQ